MKRRDAFDGIWLEGGQISWRDNIPVPDLPSGEALIRPLLAGICGTDLELIRGYYPYTGIFGHEFVGQVTCCPDNPEWEGQRVVGEINASCQTCPTCRAGRPSHCPHRTVLGIVNRQGVFGQAFTLPAANLLRVPDGLPDEAAVFAEPLAAALQILQQVKISPTDKVLIVGAGRLGQLICQVLCLTGCELMVAELHPRTRDQLSQQGLLVVGQDDPALHGSVDVVVEAAGSADGFATARRMVRPGGTIVAKSTYKGALNLDYASLVVDEITVVGSRCGPMAPALQLMATGEVDPTRLIAARHPLRRGLQALKEAALPSTLKVLLDIN